MHIDPSKSQTVAKAFADDSEEEERMVMAMDRTEALRGEETFYFFRASEDENMELSFRTEGLDVCGLALLQDDIKRQRACTSGFLALVAAQKGLPAPLVYWIHNQTLQEKSQELCESYVAIIDALVTGEHEVPDLAFSLSETHSGQTFRDMEGSSQFDDGAALPDNLQNALLVMAALAPRTSPFDQARALAELILLNNDENARSDIDTRLNIERAMHAILESNTEESLQTVFRETTRQIIHVTSISKHLLSRAIVSLPATTLRLHCLRRRLALHIVLDAPLDEDIDVTSPSTGVRLLLRMKKHGSFLVSETSDYTALTSLSHLLDIAIDVGFSDLAFLDKNAVQDGSSTAKSASLFSHASTPRNPAETSFNSQIDAIVSQLGLMCSKIRDAGTSHLKRTEAKHALERLIVRLKNAVRTKPLHKQGVFDRSRTSTGNMSAGALEGFLWRAGSGRDTVSSKSEGKDIGGAGVLGRNESVQRVPGTQHKVTWRDDVVGMGDAGAGADDSDDSM